MPQPADPLHDLRDHVRATQEAAERLAGDAARAARARAAGGVPPSGWATEQERATLRHELEEVASLLRVLRDVVPPELQAQLADVLRQVLLLVRALLDWWIDRLDTPGEAGSGAGRPARGAQAQDIPIA